jgi:hypothetical protein
MKDESTKRDEKKTHKGKGLGHNTRAQNFLFIVDIIL